MEERTMEGLFEKVLKFVFIVTMCLLFAMRIESQVNAQDYYNKKLNDYDKQVPYEKKGTCPQISLCFKEFNKTEKVTAVKDFNQDGNLEKVELKVKLNKYGKGKSTIRINDTAVAEKNKTFGDCYYLKMYKLENRSIVVLSYMFSDDSARAVVYEWTGNKLKEVKSIGDKGYLSIYIAKDRTLNKDVLYIQYSLQLINHYGQKWPSNVLKRYKKYAKKKNVSVTKTTYEKYSYKGRNLKKQGVDNYYRVSNVYD